MLPPPPTHTHTHTHGIGFSELRKRHGRMVLYFGNVVQTFAAIHGIVKMLLGMANALAV